VKVNKIFTLTFCTYLIASSNWTGPLGGRRISYPFGRKLLNPEMRSWWPLRNSSTFSTTLPTLILQNEQDIINQYVLRKSKLSLSPNKTQQQNMEEVEKW